MPPFAPLPDKLKTDIHTVEELCGLAQQGRLRIPSFQRPFRWDQAHVRDLFDSIYRGYPVGALLLWQRPARAERVQIGRLVVDADAFQDALWIVDGQQRITTLVSCLIGGLSFAERPLDVELYFDPKVRTFEIPDRRCRTPDHWVPVHRLLDAAELGDWLYEWRYGPNSDWRRAVLNAGKRLREYALPLYLVRTDDVETLKLIFRRMNDRGMSLSEEDVFRALQHEERGEPRDLDALLAEIQRAEFGVFKRKTVLASVLVLSGLDPYRKLGGQWDAEGDIDNSSLSLSLALHAAAPAIGRTISFLREYAKIAHARLLPYRAPLVVLPLFFERHPEPSTRSLILLSRWVWRGFLTGEHATPKQTTIHAAIRVIKSLEDEQECVQNLLKLLPSTPVFWSPPERYNANQAPSRIGLLGLESLTPRNIFTSASLAVPQLLLEHKSGLCQRIVPSKLYSGERALGIANRLIHPPTRDLSRALIACHEAAVLRSHGIDERAFSALRSGRYGAFLAKREMSIVARLRQFGGRMAAWGRSDRPSIEHLLAG